MQERSISPLQQQQQLRGGQSLSKLFDAYSLGTMSPSPNPSNASRSKNRVVGRSNIRGNALAGNAPRSRVSLGGRTPPQPPLNSMSLGSRRAYLPYSMARRGLMSAESVSFNGTRRRNGQNGQNGQNGTARNTNSVNNSGNGSGNNSGNGSGNNSGNGSGNNNSPNSNRYGYRYSNEHSNSNSGPKNNSKNGTYDSNYFAQQQGENSPVAQRPVAEFNMPSPFMNAQANNPNAQNPGPHFWINPTGGVVNYDFAPPPLFKVKRPSCGKYVGSPGGLRNEAFLKCYQHNLMRKIAPYMKLSFGKDAAAMDLACGPKNKGLGPHQIIVYEIARLMASYPTDLIGEHRGLLAFHNAGSGKTISMLAVIMAFWPSDKKIFVISTDQINAKNMREFVVNAPAFFKKEFDAIVKQWRVRYAASSGSQTQLSDLEIFDRALKERVKALTFVKARNRLDAKPGEYKTVKSEVLDAGSGSVLLIDEAQNLQMKGTGGYKNQSEDALRLGCALRAMNKEKMRLVRVFGFTATPGNTLKEWLKMLSLVRRADQQPFTRDDDFAKISPYAAQSCASASHNATIRPNEYAPVLEKLLYEAAVNKSQAAIAQLQKEFANGKFLGLVSYADMRSDTSRHACFKEELKLYRMERWHYLLMLYAQVMLHKDKAKARAQNRYDNHHPMAYMMQMRQYGSWLPMTLIKKLPEGVQKELGRTGRLFNNAFLSQKLIHCADYLAAKPGKHYLYASRPSTRVSPKNRNTVSLLSEYLQIRKGYERVTAKNASSLQPNGKNFIVIDSTMKLDDPKSEASALIKLYNDPKNLTGKYIKIVIVTDNLYEGIDFKALQYVHLLDPLPNGLMETQAVGRGVRYCSHTGLPLAQRQVTVVRWFSLASKGTLDDLIRLFYTSKIPKTLLLPIKNEYNSRISPRPAPRPGRPYAYDELVFKTARRNKDFIVMTNLERLIQASTLECRVLRKFHRSVSCFKPIYVDKVKITPGTRCR